MEKMHTELSKKIIRGSGPVQNIKEGLSKPGILELRPKR